MMSYRPGGFNPNSNLGLKIEGHDYDQPLLQMSIIQHI